MRPAALASAARAAPASPPPPSRTVSWGASVGRAAPAQRAGDARPERIEGDRQEQQQLDRQLDHPGPGQQLHAPGRGPGRFARASGTRMSENGQSSGSPRPPSPSTSSSAWLATANVPDQRGAQHRPAPPAGDERAHEPGEHRHRQRVRGAAVADRAVVGNAQRHQHDVGVGQQRQRGEGDHRRRASNEGVVGGRAPLRAGDSRGARRRRDQNWPCLNCDDVCDPR